MKTKRSTSLQEKQRIIELYKDGHSLNKISQITHNRFQTVKATIQEYNSTGRFVESIPGRPRITNNALQIISALTVQNRLTSCF